MRLLPFLALMFILASCSSPSLKSSSTVSSDTVSIFFVSNRRLELEPCGCSFNPIGGLEREWNLLKKWKEESPNYIVLNGGTTIYPRTYEKPNEAFYQKKVDYLFEGIHAMGGEILSPGSSDLYLGVEKLKNKAATHGIVLVNANLHSPNGKTPLFDPYAERKIAGKPMIIIGLAAPSAVLKKNKSFVVGANDEALGAVFSKVSTEGKLVVLLADVKNDERNRLIRKFPIHIVLGGNDLEETKGARQPLGKVLVMNPTSMGRSIGRLDLALKLPVTGFFNDETAMSLVYARVGWRKEIAKLTAKLKKGEASKAERKETQERLNTLKAALLDAETVEPEATLATTSFRGIIETLEAPYSQPRNVMTDLFDRYKKEVETSAKTGDF